MLKAVLFDLDGTLLPMNEEEFTKGYFGLLCKKVVPYGYDTNELTTTIWQGTKAMIKNDGEKTNEEVFWEEFEKVYGKDKLKDKNIFDEFYVTDFKKTQVFCGENGEAKEVVTFAKIKNLKVILASNPLFPRAGMLTRMKFVCLEEKDFDYITSYENSHYAKPNPKYYEEILKKNNLRADEVIYFCNSGKEDVEPSSACGIKSYLVGNVSSEDSVRYGKIEFNEIKSIIGDEIESRKK